MAHVNLYMLLHMSHSAFFASAVYFIISTRMGFDILQNLPMQLLRAQTIVANDALTVYAFTVSSSVPPLRLEMGLWWTHQTKIGKAPPSPSTPFIAAY